MIVAVWRIDIHKEKAQRLSAGPRVEAYLQGKAKRLGWITAKLTSLYHNAPVDASYLLEKAHPMLELLQDPSALRGLDTLLTRGAAKRAGITLADHSHEILDVIEKAICRLPESAATDAALDAISDLGDAHSDAERDEAFTQARVAVFDLGDDVSDMLMEWREVDTLRRRALSGETDAATSRIAAPLPVTFDPPPLPPTKPQQIIDAGIRERIGSLSPHQQKIAYASLKARGFVPEPRVLRLLSPADCAASPPRGYVIKGLIAPRDLVLMVAKPGGGKSALAPSMGYAIAQGQPVFDRRTKPGTVLYVPCEDPHGMRQRVHALKLTHGDAPAFLIVEGVSDLCSLDSPDPAALRQLVIRQHPALIVIDTVAAAWRGLEENQSEDMARVIGVSRSLTDEGCAVMLLCHPAKSLQSDGTARGHGSLNGDADVSLFLEWQPDGSAITVRMTKNRNGPAYGDGMAFTIKGVRVGTDEDGDAIFAPVAHEVEAPPPTPKRKQTADGIALGFLAGLIASHGQPLPTGDGYPAGFSGVTEEDWRQACDSQRLSTAATEANRNRAFNRAYANLLFRRAIGARDGLVWIPQPEGMP